MKKIIIALLYMAVPFLATSCMKDGSWNEDDATGEAQVILNINLPGAFSSETRSLDFASENTIDNIYVLTFNQSNNLTDIKQAENLSPAPGPDPNYVPGNQYSATYNFTVTLPPTMGGNTTRLVVLANAVRILTNTVGTSSASSYIGRPYADVVAAIYDGISSAMYPETPPVGRIPMWGETPQIQIAPGNSNQTVDMTRAVARIDVGVGQPAFDNTTKTYSWNGNNSSGAAIPFRLTSVTVIRPNNRYAVVPAQANHTDAGVATAPTIPSGTSAFSLADSKTNFTYNTPGGYLSTVIYTPEADIRMGVGAAPSDANHNNRMALVVGGNYNNSSTTTYYRLEFAVNNNLIDVLRNHLYQFSIANVTGPGFATVDEAAASQTMFMTANVLQWNMNTIGAELTGTNTLTLTPRDTVRLYSNQYTAISPVRDNVITAFTDVPAGWTVNRVVATDDSTPVTWLTLSPTSGAANTRTDITVSASQNTTGAPRTAHVWFAAGRLRYRVVVVQGISPAIELRIMNSGNTQEINQLTFNAPAGTAPAAQSFNVRWLPATNPATVAIGWNGLYEFPNPGSNPAVADGAPYNGQSIQPGNGTYTYNVSPPAITTAEAAANPFIQKSTRFDFSVNNGFTTITKGITLTNVNYALLVEPNPFTAPYFPMDGNQYNYYVRSNTTWRISNITESPRVSGTRLIAAQTGADNVYANAVGGPNTTPGSGWRETFKTNGSARGMSGYADVTYSSDKTPAQFTSVTRRLFFPAAQFNIFSICLMSSNSPDARNFSFWSGSGPSQPPFTDHDVHSMINGPTNFGSSTTGSGTSDTFSAKVPVQGIGTYGLWVGGSSSGASNGSTYSGTSVTVDMINAAVAANADMLVISGDAVIPWSSAGPNSEANAIYNNFLAKDKPVLLFTNNSSSVLGLFVAARNAGKISGDMSGSDGLNGKAALYVYGDFSDPLLEGPFPPTSGAGTYANMRGRRWGCDGNSSGNGGNPGWWFTNPANNNVIIYSNMVNSRATNSAVPAQNVSPNGAAASRENGASSFRFANVPLFVSASGGWLSTVVEANNSTAYPGQVNSSSKVPEAKSWGDFYCYNSFMLANIMTWAIQRRTTQ